VLGLINETKLNKCLKQKTTFEELYDDLFDSSKVF
jgi:hypothetical protein